MSNIYFTQAPPGQCGTPDCEKPRAEGRYVCADHAGRLDRIRTELQDAARRKIHRSKRAPTCCFPGCYEHRSGTAAFCFAHRDEVEETY